jgi:type I restriction enzyme, S subunit
MASLNQQVIEKIPLVLPSKEVLGMAAGIIQPLEEKSSANRQENKALSQLRDTLLPKLLSGEIRVKDAEYLMGETA